jgi:hypothetical protein
MSIEAQAHDSSLFAENLTKAEASKRIDALKQRLADRN